ncbi:MAG TPA: alpha-amylase family glycosyl hydrolase, partial [Pelobium sp.]|nr:alpha-amylase family glycosyl hydrolase [Pelobium sp.]
VKTDDVHLFIDPERNELDMLYHFEGMGIGFTPDGFKEPHPDGYSLMEFKQVYSKWDKAFAKGWGTIYLGNHDQPRMLTRWGNDSKEFRELSAKMLHTFLLTMRATPFIYHGDEIGMNNIKFDNITDYRDIESINMHQYLTSTGGDLQRFMSAQKITARDNGRTPFQWDASENSGFTDGKPWLKVNPNYTQVNSEAQENEPDSILNYFRKLINLRKKYRTLIYGEYQILDATNQSVYAYSREDENGLFIILLNFTSNEAEFNIDFDCLTNAELIIGNYATCTAKNSLKPYEACVFKSN